MSDKTLLIEALEAAKIHLKRAKFNYDQLKNFSDAELLDQKNMNMVDAFMLRFVKLQDVMGAKIFKFLLNALGENCGNMSVLDMLDRLEKLEIIPSADEWMEFRKKRNELTHEYPQNEESVLAGIKMALDQFLQIEKVLFGIEQRSKNLK
ncbi:MAG: hypothetical protein KGP29_01945 [Proteobacteria bacterium]|nr:hypothetical protein [Pseudomonadota bacterium]